MQLSEQQKHFFQTFGYLVFPGLLKTEIETITTEFHAVADGSGAVHDESKRTCIVQFVDRSEKLCALLDHPDLRGIATGLLGDDFNYLGSDGNYYTGDTGWHSDGYHKVGTFIKFAFYLDEVKKETGALRVIPGSHRLEMRDWPALQSSQAPKLWGVEQNHVPSVALESKPGDVVVFNHNLMHAAFGGSTRRRMFTMNLSTRANTPEEIADLKNYIASGARFWMDDFYGDTMLQSADAERLSYLQQVLDHSGHLPALVAKAKLEMSEPARG